MFANVTFNGETLGEPLEEDGTVSVAFDDEGDVWRCEACGEDFNSKYEADEDCGDAECETHETGEECEVDDDHCRALHELVAERRPLAWVNSARITVNENNDQVEVAISIGDLMGAFAMRVYRTDEGRIIMDVPHPENSHLHLPLKVINERGAYAVNETEPSE